MGGGKKRRVKEVYKNKWAREEAGEKTEGRWQEMKQGRARESKE